MKVKKYTTQELEYKISELKRMKGTRLEKPTDKKYIKAYEKQLQNLKNS